MLPETRVHPLLNPLKIGNVTIEKPFFLAPMAGQTNYAFRKLSREYGDCGLVCTELISSAAMQYAEARERAHLKFDWVPEEETPVAVQLFGADPYQMAEAAKIVVDHGADIVDINMGCWVPKVARTGGGAILLKDVCSATAVVEAVVKAVSVPVTVKIRAGWERENPTAIPFARAAEDVGVALIAVHWRFATQGFKGNKPDWHVIGEVKDAVNSIPVIGNGDVHTTQDAMRMVEETGCDGVMIGRAALGQPWIFKHIEHYLRTGETLPEPSRAQRARYAWQHAHYTLETTHLAERKAILELRGQISKYRLDEVGSVKVRNQLVRIESVNALDDILTPIMNGA